MPPHLILGYTLAEWSAIIGLLVTISGSLYGVGKLLINSLKKSISEPLLEGIKDLGDRFGRFEEDSHSAHKRYDKKIENHERRISRLEGSDDKKEKL